MGGSQVGGRPVPTMTHVRTVFTGSMTRAVSYNARLFDETFQLSFAEVADTNCFGLALLLACLHGLVRLDVVSITWNDLSVLVPREELVAIFEWRWPVHKVKVDIVGVESLQASIKLLLDTLRLVCIVP